MRAGQVNPTQSRVLAVILIAAFGIRLAIAWAPFEWLIRTVLGDDPFYYFTIARNFVSEHGFSFDTVEPTNGFHPLWMFLILPIFKFVHDPIVAIHSVLTLAALLDTLSLLLIFKLLEKCHVRIEITVVIAAVYSVLPLLLSTSGALNGLETSLNITLLLAFLILYHQIFEQPAVPRSLALRFGLYSGLLFLARTDNGILLACSFVFLVWNRRRSMSTLNPVFVSAATAGIVLLPWLLWSYENFGSLVQVSGLSVGYFMRELVARGGWTIADYGKQFVRNSGVILGYIPGYLKEAHVLSWPNLPNIAFWGVLSLGLFRARHRSDLWEKAKPWLGPGISVFIFLLVHTLRGVQLRGWYYASMLPIAILFVAITLEQIAQFDPRRRVISWVAGIICGYSVLVSIVRLLPPGCGETDAYRMIQVVNDTLPEGSRVGSWNAGLFGYFFTRGQVVNLDGLVNNRAYEHILDHSLGEYCYERDISFLLDAEGAVNIWKPYWNHAGEVNFPDPLIDNAKTCLCRRILLLPLKP